MSQRNVTLPLTHATMETEISKYDFAGPYMADSATETQFKLTTWDRAVSDHLSQEVRNRTKWVLPCTKIGEYVSDFDPDDHFPIELRDTHYSDFDTPVWSEPFSILGFGSNDQAVIFQVRLAICHDVTIRARYSYDDTKNPKGSKRGLDWVNSGPLTEGIPLEATLSTSPHLNWWPESGDATWKLDTAFKRPLHVLTWDELPALTSAAFTVPRFGPLDKAFGKLISGKDTKTVKLPLKEFEIGCGASRSLLLKFEQGK
ncbi:uncharacterized protein MKK02DRAFT_40162 [Dioszegia hungarica]|uniref:Uncharacterized protein n=1 Tax=Dioszegia hungarica TaxID=4972 RepID=A0AA38HFR2_9TREE|nr:uncharacterized protein MKK02DRAFT_40162 [Dioszegia hungarica]KAI9639835.1 hypothetical protein MKK02DRAFT_40162 [Dioszegia hungarica]